MTHESAGWSILVQQMKSRKSVPGRIGLTRRRILALILEGGNWSHRELADRLGLNFSGMTKHLEALQKLGLISFESARARTIQPTCRFIPVEELMKGTP